MGLVPADMPQWSRLRRSRRVAYSAQKAFLAMVLRRIWACWAFVFISFDGASAAATGDAGRRRRVVQGTPGPDCNLVPFSGVFSAYVLDTCVVWVLRLGAACVVLPLFAI